MKNTSLESEFNADSKYALDFTWKRQGKWKLNDFWKEVFLTSFSFEPSAGFQVRSETSKNTQECVELFTLSKTCQMSFKIITFASIFG